MPPVRKRRLDEADCGKDLWPASTCEAPGTMDKTYIAPQLTLCEKVTAGAYALSGLLLVLTVIGTSALVSNLFSPTFPWRWKVVNVLVLLLPLALLAALIALVFRLV